MTGKCREYLNTFMLKGNATCIGFKVKRRAEEKLSSHNWRRGPNRTQHWGKVSANIERTQMGKVSSNSKITGRISVISPVFINLFSPVSQPRDLVPTPCLCIVHRNSTGTNPYNHPERVLQLW